MQIFKAASSLRRFLVEQRAQGRKIGFVPTMGALHEGHISLVKRARQEAEAVVVSIFVNPTQFNNSEDLLKYPRTLDQDCALLERYGVVAVYAPTEEEIYGSNFQSWVENEKLSRQWEGASRPGHFRGVATVVTILLNTIGADCAVFGEKDFQQLRIVEQLVADLRLPTRIIRGETSREEGGLARSSRNERLSADGRVRARALSQALFIARDAFRGGERSVDRLLSLAHDRLHAESAIAADYLAIVDELRLEQIAGAIHCPARILLAASIEGVRLIDNVALTPP